LNQIIKLHSDTFTSDPYDRESNRAEQRDHMVGSILEQMQQLLRDADDNASSCPQQKY
jgi:hypothetical protein